MISVTAFNLFAWQKNKQRIINLITLSLNDIQYYSIRMIFQIDDTIIAWDSQISNEPKLNSVSITVGLMCIRATYRYRRTQNDFCYISGYITKKHHIEFA